MLYFINFFLGYVLIRITSPTPERFLNLLAKKNIPFWDLTRIDFDTLSLCIPASDFLKIRPIARRTMSKIHILKKVGIPFFAMRFKRRIPLIASFLTLGILLFVTTSFIWTINISGCSSVSESIVREHLAYNGVKIGGYSKSIDYKDLKNDMLLSIPDLVNITVNITGSHAEVEVHERKHAPEIIDDKTPSNIVADFDGIISKITVTSGTPEVTVGDAVTRGTLLASGYMTGRTGTTVRMRAIADIQARTWHNLTIISPDVMSIKEYTGKTKQEFALVFGNFRINLFSKGSNLYTKYDKIIKKTVLTLPFDIALPIALEKATLCEYTTQSVPISSDSFSKQACNEAEKFINLNEGDSFMLKSCDFSQSSGRLTASITAECERKIGIEQMIPKGE